MIYKVISTGFLNSRVKEMIINAGCDIKEYGRRDLIDVNLLINALKGVHAYILGGDERITKYVFDQINDLKLITYLGAGYQSSIDVLAATEKDVVITFTPGANKQATAEFTVSLMLSLWRQIPFLANITRQELWISNMGNDIKGKTIGIIGMGAVGTIVAKIAYFGLGMKIVYFSNSPIKEIEHETEAVFVSLDEVCRESDVITLHVPLNSDTRNLIDTPQFELMKTGAILINTSRPAIVNGKALYNSLVNKKVSMAAFDGYYCEPNPISNTSDPFNLSNLPINRFIVTPHTAGRTYESKLISEKLAAENIIRMINGTTYKNRVN